MSQTVYLPSGNSVVKFDAVTGTYQGLLGAGFFPSGTTAAVAQSPVDGYLYVASNASGAGILRFDPYTGAYAGILGAGFVGTADDLCFGADGTLYVANFTSPAPNILRFNPITGEYRGLFASGFYGAGLASITAIDDTIYVSENSSIYRFDGPTGTYQGLFGNGFVQGARGIASDESRIYAGRNSTQAVTRFVASTGEYRGLVAAGWANSVLGIDVYGTDMMLIRSTFLSGGQGVMRFERSTGTYKGLLGANFNLSGAGIAVEQPALVSGTLTLQDYSGGPRLVLWEVVDGSGNVLDSGTIGPTTGGAFSFRTYARGTFDVKLKASHWLKRANTAVNIARGGASGLSFSLLNGDVNNDNEVGPADFSLLSAAFGSFLGDPNYDAEADLNGDEEVGPADFAILAANFGEFGD